MTRNVSYKLATCDICGIEEQTSQSAVLPDKWERIICGGYFDYDLCPKCRKTIQKSIEIIKEKNMRGEQNGQTD